MTTGRIAFAEQALTELACVAVCVRARNALLCDEPLLLRAPAKAGPGAASSAASARQAFTKMVRCAGIDIVLVGCPALTTLCLSDTSLSPAMLSTLADAVSRASCALAALDISQCDIDDTHAESITALVRPNKLRSLHLRHNLLGEIGAMVLAAALCRSSRLERLDVAWNALGVDGATAVTRAANVHRVCLDLEGNVVRTDHFAKARRAIKRTLQRRALLKATAQHDSLSYVSHPSKTLCAHARV